MGSGAGLHVGQAVAPFEPYHVTGPYANTRQCPVCEYGMLPMVFVWTHVPNKAIDAMGATLQSSVNKYGKDQLKTFIVDVNASNDDNAAMNRLKSLASNWKNDRVWLLYRTSKMNQVLTDHALKPMDGWESITYVVRNREVKASFVNLSSSAADQKKLSDAIDAMMK